MKKMLLIALLTTCVICGCEEKQAPVATGKPNFTGEAVRYGTTDGGPREEEPGPNGGDSYDDGNNGGGSYDDNSQHNDSSHNSSDSSIDETPKPPAPRTSHIKATPPHPPKYN